MKDSAYLMIKLKSSFQQEIFRRIVDREKGSIKAGKILDIPASSVRGYKNLYFDSVPKELISKLIDAKVTKNPEVEANIIGTFDKKDLINGMLTRGRERRTNQLKKWKSELPDLRAILKNGFLDFEKWFGSYQKLINFGVRKFNYIKTRRNYIETSYEMHSKGHRKRFVLKFPRKIKIDDKFIYFFGLWCGDRSGGKRFGVCNQDRGIIEFVENFLRTNYQNVEKILYISKGLIEPPIKYDKRFVIDKEIRGWVLSVHSTNGIFSSFFHHLQKYLKQFLSVSDNYPFFAGLFDAEGNVSLHNRSFRWACKNPNLVSTYSKFMGELDLFDRYDGCCLISYNTKKFYEKIYPYLRHDKKANSTLFLCRGDGTPPKKFISILSHLKNKPERTAREIAKALKENKVYSELKLLDDFGFISYGSFPRRFKLTSKGLESLGDLKL